jgi:hypothetical protein
MSRNHTEAVEAASVKATTQAWPEAGTGGKADTQSPLASAVVFQLAVTLTALQLRNVVTVLPALAQPQTRALAGAAASTACSENERATVNGEKDVAEDKGRERSNSRREADATAMAAASRLRTAAAVVACALQWLQFFFSRKIFSENFSG